MKESAVVTPGGTKTKVRSCVPTPHSWRATTATLLLDAGVDTGKVPELLGHRHVTTTQISDTRRRSTAESASHDEVHPKEERGCGLGIDSVRHFVRNGRFARSEAHEPATILAAIGPAVQSQEA